MPPKAVDSTWVTTYKGKPWPVVLCDDQHAPPGLMQTRPVGHVFPAILLGKHIYVWVVDDQLMEFDPSKDYLQDSQPLDSDKSSEKDGEEVKLEKCRHDAFTKDALHFESADFWVNYIRSKSEARRLEREMAVKDKERARRQREKESLGKRQRRATVNGDDSDLEILGWTTNSSSRRQTQRVSRKGRGSGRNGYLPTPGPTPTKPSLSNRGRSTSKAELDDFDDEDDDELLVQPKRSPSDPFVSENGDRKWKEVRKRAAANVPDISNDPDSCLILVGNETEQTPFVVPYKAVGQSDILADQVEWRTCGNTINLAYDAEITATAFMPVAEYLRDGEFAPVLIDKNGLRHLAGVALQDEKHKPAVHVAYGYMVAAKLSLNDLQTLCFDKLSAIYPLSPLTLVYVLRLYAASPKWDAEVEGPMRDWLIAHVAEFYWVLVDQHGGALSRMLRQDEELSRGVHAMLANGESDGMRGCSDD